MYPFEMTKPLTIADASAQLRNEDAQAIAGGQTLIPTLKQRLAAPEILVSLTDIAEMKGVCENAAGQLCIGAATTHAQIARDGGRLPALAALAGQIGDPAVRNRGTIGGSIANNDPSACYPAAALGCRATIITENRSIAADDYFQGLFTTALDENELVTEIRFDVPQIAYYQKFVQPASRFALVGVFVAKFADGVRVAVTGASEDGVYRWSEAETALTNHFDPAALGDITHTPDGMIADLHGSVEYRAHLVQVMTTRAVTAALSSVS